MPINSLAIGQHHNDIFKKSFNTLSLIDSHFHPDGSSTNQRTTPNMATTNGTLSSTHANGTSTSNPATAPKIHLYTNHRCPFAQRAHIVLEELGLPFEETIIDLDTPRPQWYLDINPRGKVNGHSPPMPSTH